MKCIFDNNLPIKLAKTLHYLEGPDGISVNHISEIMDSATADEIWIKKYGKEGNCFIITRDNMIKKNPHELKAWKEAKLTIIFMQNSWLRLSFWDICWKFIKAWPELKSTIEKSINKKSFILHIQGRIEQI